MGELMTGENMTLILGVLFAISELMGSNEKIKANGIFDFFHKILKSLVSKK